MNTVTSFSAHKLIIIIIAVAVVVGGGAFYGGMKYVQGSGAGARGQFSRSNFQNLSPEERQQRFQELGANGAGGMGARGGMNSGGFTAGEIISKDASSVTIKMQDGSTKIVLVGSSTQVMKSTTGSFNELTTGANVTVMGTVNSDGSVTAQVIQLRPFN